MAHAVGRFAVLDYVDTEVCREFLGFDDFAFSDPPVTRRGRGQALEEDRKKVLHMLKWREREEAAAQALIDKKVAEVAAVQRQVARQEGVRKSAEHGAVALAAGSAAARAAAEAEARAAAEARLRPAEVVAAAAALRAGMRMQVLGDRSAVTAALSGSGETGRVR